MGKLRFLLALWLAKLSVPALKITRHNGTDFPGSLALKLCPDFLRYVGKPGTIIAVTGTNGKTTVSNLLTDILEADGKKVLSNRSGSNITSGISTALLRGCDLLGRAKSYDMAVLEVDERASVRIFPYVKPDYAVVTNLTRDSIMRNAHPGYIADILTRSIPQTATMILNADDLITCGVAPENRRVYFGVDRLPGDTTRCENLIDDLRICPKCSGKLTYVYRRYHHIGKCVCPDCGFRSPESDYLATDVDMEKGTMALREGGEEHPYRLISDSVPNLYNMVTVIAVLRQLGYSHEAISGYMSRAAVVATRHMEEQVGNVKLVRQMSKEKNALAGSRTFQYIAQRPGTKELLLMMNCLGDAHHWSENTCWIFDADFEYLRNDSVVQLVCTGARCRDYKLRLLMAGVPEERIVCEPDEFRAAELLHYTPGDDVYILYGTDSLALSYKVYDHMKEEAARHAQGGAEKEGQGGVDLVYMGSATEKGLELMVKALTPYREELAARVDGGQRMLVTGNALDALGEYVQSDQGLRFDGLGLLPTHAEYQMMNRHNSFFLGTYGTGMEIVGFKSLFGHTYGADDPGTGLFKVVRGVGRRPGSLVEGFRRGGLMATYLTGPLLVLNPPFTKQLLQDLGAEGTLAFEEAAMEAYEARLAEFRDEKRSYLY